MVHEALRIVLIEDVKKKTHQTSACTKSSYTSYSAYSVKVGLANRKIIAALQTILILTRKENLNLQND